jgi:hypothetical protein
MDESAIEEKKVNLISESLEAELLKKHSENPTDFLKRVFANKKVVILGDRHNSPAMETFLRNSLSPLKNSGITHLVLEEHRDYQPEIDSYLNNEEEMNNKLVDYLRNGFYRRDVIPHDYRVLLLQEAKRVGLKVRFVDPGSVENRDEVWENELNDILKDPETKVLMVCGQNHAIKVTPGVIANRLLKRLPGQIYTVFEVTDNEPIRIKESCYVGEEIVNILRTLGQETKSLAFDLFSSPFSKLKRYSHRPSLGEEYDGVVFLAGETRLEKRQPQQISKKEVQS